MQTLNETSQSISSSERAIQCAAQALDKKGLDVRILEIGRLSSIADFLVLATGSSDKQVQAMADAVKMGLKPFGAPLSMEGVNEGKWVVIDYGDVIVHIFHEEQRRYYNLDELWNNATELPVPEQYLWEHKQA